MAHHLLFEGPELAGKSWLIAQIYDFLEIKYNTTKGTLDGCHWFNSDVGIFGTKNGKFCVKKYIDILEKIKDKNVLFEKFHISDIVYNRIFRNIEVNYKGIENKMKKLNEKIILCVFEENTELLKKRIKDRLKLYPHCERVLRDPQWYINQQREYIKEIKKTKLPHLIIDLSVFPNKKHLDVLKWIGEI